MSLRNQVKQLLKMCGHAFVGTIHERLNHTDRQLDIVIDQNNRLARAQTALLQSSIHIVETLRDGIDTAKRERRSLEEQNSRLEEQYGRLEEQNSRLVDRTTQLQQELTGFRDYTRTFFEQELVRQVSVETSDYEFTNPEMGLMAFLYSFLPSRKAIDIGAHLGEVSERLLKTGYEVYAFEPLSPVYEKLAQRFDGNADFHAHNFALGSEEAEMTLHLAEDLSGSGSYDDATAFSSLAPHSMPDDLPFTATTQVPVRTLENLHRERILPDDIAVAKIDTEGFDLEVIRGMGEHRYPVVATEFWDTGIPFGRSGLLYTLESLVGDMKDRGYQWHIVLYRIWGRNQTAFYSNHDRPVPDSWGNVVFFQDYDLFAQAQMWCSAVLPRTYFKAAPSQ